MSRSFPLVAEAREVVRPVLVAVGAITVVACIMAFKGWEATSLALGGVIVLLAGVLVFQVHRAVSHLRDQSAAVKLAAAESERHYAEVLSRIVKFSEARDPYLQGHSERVGQLAEKTARKLGFSDADALALNLAGKLHDVGMLAIPAKMLAQPSRLTTDSLQCVKEHCQIGYEILKPMQCLEQVLPAIRYHHERMNGTGYPEGLKGEQIPAEARILAVADAFDAMTHDRPYRRAMPPVDAMRELRRCTPAGYDAICVNALADIMFLPNLDAAQERKPTPMKEASALKAG